MKNAKQSLILIALFFLSAIFTPSIADTIWNDQSASPYTTEKAYKLGDIISIVIAESTKAQNNAGTKTDVKDDLAMKLNHTLTQLAPIIGTNLQFNASWGNKYSGQGQTSRTNSVAARISAWVTDVLPNGNLSIIGKHKVTVNDEMQEITISGIVRPKDISGSNTVFSYQVANADVLIKGTGTVAESESAGWLTRFLNWLF
ncbi:MAG: flagellar basal body L-ring protein FlgH [Candidatus Margulisiibacteriota bacterium]